MLLSMTKYEKEFKNLFISNKIKNWKTLKVLTEKCDNNWALFEIFAKYYYCVIIFIISLG